jgi:hypothetical protein
LAIVNKSHQASQLYPYAISLIESVRAYERTCNIISNKPTLSLLVSGLKGAVQVLITEVGNKDEFEVQNRNFGRKKRFKFQHCIALKSKKIFFQRGDPLLFSFFLHF